MVPTYLAVSSTVGGPLNDRMLRLGGQRRGEEGEGEEGDGQAVHSHLPIAAMLRRTRAGRQRVAQAPLRAPARADAPWKSHRETVRPAAGDAETCVLTHRCADVFAMRSMLQNRAESLHARCEPQRVALHLKHGVTLLGFARVESPQIARLDFAWSGQDISDRRSGGRPRETSHQTPKGGGCLATLSWES
jgi:hypothetical protein